MEVRGPEVQDSQQLPTPCTVVHRTSPTQLLITDSDHHNPQTRFLRIGQEGDLGGSNVS
jgi:hypothetical protein